MPGLSIQDRVLVKAHRILREGRVAYARPAYRGFIGMVEGDSGEVYKVYVDPRRGVYRCECRFYRLTKRPCKHVVALLLYLQNSIAEKGSVSRNLHHHVISVSRVHH